VLMRAADPEKSLRNLITAAGDREPANDHDANYE
jgi:hypothetical protein